MKNSPQMNNPLVKAYMLGYYEAMKDHGRALHDVELDDMSELFGFNLALLAIKNTQHLDKTVINSPSVDESDSLI
jgi:hypothetical protein